MRSKTHIRIGTRGSDLALFQARLTQSKLEQSCRNHGFPYTFEIVIIKTTGDKVLDRRLSEMGGKALFTKEIDLALLDGRIDIAVHSVKDCETFFPPAFEIAAILEREDPRDAFISEHFKSVEDIPLNSVFGTCSLRRTSQLLHLRPDLKTILFRGNVHTRINKVLTLKEADFTLLAKAGLERLGMNHKASFVLSTELMTPCAGQGAIGIVCLKERIELKECLETINHKETFDAVMLERFFLEAIQGHCGTPVGALATFTDENTTNKTHFIACVASPNGQNLWRETIHEPTKKASPSIAKLGREMRKWLKAHDV